MSTPQENRWRFLAALASTTALVASVSAIVIVATDDGGGGSGTGPSSTKDAHVLEVSLSEFAITGTLTAPAGPVTIHATNKGSVPHNIGIVGGASSSDFGGGESETLDLGDLEAGTYELWCSLPAHKEAGMSTTLVITEGGSTATTSTDTKPEHDYAAMDKAMAESIAQFPAATEGLGNQPLEPRVLADGTKQFDITAKVTKWEVEPGKVVDAWTYNGQVPGPAMKVSVGDKVRVIVHNELPMGTDVHFHGVKLPFNMDGVAPVTQDLIKPSEEFAYEFVAEIPTVAMYHAHHHAQMQVPNGLFGTFTIGDAPVPRGQTVGGVAIPADLKIAKEIPMVVNDAGVIGYSLNGKSFPATEPYVVKTGDWIVAHYYNEGMQIHPMHQHQFPQLVFARDGFPLDHPYWVDTVTVAPGERYSVLMRASTPGTWVWHCHILNHVERETGMFGMVTALVVQEP